MSHEFYYALSVLSGSCCCPRGDVLRCAQHLPLAITVRAVGAPDVALQT